MIGQQSTRACYICAMKCASARTVLLLGVALSSCSRGSASKEPQKSAPVTIAEPAQQAPPPRPEGKGQIVGFVFNDTNRNGAFDKSETRMPGQTVMLVDSQTGGTLESVSTDADGRFRFEKIAPGPYRVTLKMPETFERTRDNSFVLTVKPDGSSSEVQFGVASSAAAATPAPRRP